MWGNLGKEPDSAPFDYHSQSTLVRKMKSFGVDAEWIPGEERCHWEHGAKMAKYEKKALRTALHAQTSYHHGVDC